VVHALLMGTKMIRPENTRLLGPLYKKYAGMGVRIEDDILITATVNEILSSRAPKEIADIEKLMREKSPHNLLK
jgi:Xaa-Pro aminopeptidase